MFGSAPQWMTKVCGILWAVSWNVRTRPVDHTGAEKSEVSYTQCGKDSDRQRQTDCEHGIVILVGHISWHS